ncbi:MarR family winged helix-turn-helix transcriptional regulator [Streptomyces sp. NPDC088197]|uniref:MarR family winged helix-turn-helix transcriptional regulator n=1 Tax=unclassified Streptomyces TaxID=2593676 RepID=UPI0033B98025
MARTDAPTGRRSDLLSELSVASRHYTASYALFNQALADYFGLHPTDVQCLNLLSLESRPVTIGRIAELTGLTTGSATRLVDRLERAGYVVRERDTEDRRRVMVTTVPDRMADFGRVWGGLSGGWWRMLDSYDDDQLALLLAHMRRTVDLSTAQIARLRAGDVADPGGAGEEHRGAAGA